MKLDTATYRHGEALRELRYFCEADSGEANGRRHIVRVVQVSRQHFLSGVTIEQTHGETADD